ncbi:MAG: transposase [Cyanobacteria bacterium P01_C01_bin.70]
MPNGISWNRCGLKSCPPRQQTRPLEWSDREIIDGFLYRLKNGCNRADLPQALPSYSTLLALQAVARGGYA